MAGVAVSGRIEVPAERVWSLARDFGNMDWVPGKSYLRVDGAGPGMVRTVALGSGPRARERLEAIDDAARWLEYSVLPRPIASEARPPRQSHSAGADGPPPFPVKDYRGRMQVRERDAHSCELDWSFSFEPDGVSEQEAIAAIAHVGALLFGWFKTFVER